MAAALHALGNRCALVVHGSDGLDEITTTGSTTVFRVGERVREEVWYPADFGIARASLADLVGGGREENAAIARGILTNVDRGPKRDIVLLNAAAALAMARNLTPGDALAAARASLESGAAGAVLERLQNRA